MSSGPSSMPSAKGSVERPSFRFFLWYSIGGSLPKRYWPWVLSDTTSRTWALREFARAFTVLVPLIALYIVFVPGSAGLRWLTALTFCGAFLLLFFCNILVLNDRRAVRAGFRPNHVADIRNRRSNDTHHLAVVARNERIAQRRSRRDA